VARGGKPKPPPANAVSDAAGFLFTPDPRGAAPLPSTQRPAKPPTAGPAAKPIPAPHYHGHRERLRARFAEVGAAGLRDYELLELMLYRAIPRQDTKPIAKALLDRFGSLGAVFGADPHELQKVDQVGPAVATELKAIQAVIEFVLLEQAKSRPVVSSWSSLVSYCTKALAHENREQFRVLYLDAKNQIIRDEIHSEGTVSQTSVYPREVVRRALELGAANLILVHNHPSGDGRPSAADVEITKQIVAAAKTMAIGVHDHLVIGRNVTVSFKSLGLL
jgi:DNA repair protein RadC